MGVPWRHAKLPAQLCLVPPLTLASQFAMPTVPPLPRLPQLHLRPRLLLQPRMIARVVRYRPASQDAQPTQLFSLLVLQVVRSDVHRLPLPLPPPPSRQGCVAGKIATHRQLACPMTLAALLKAA